MVCAPVRRDNPRALARDYRPYRRTNHALSHLYHNTQCRPCTLRNIWRKSHRSQITLSAEGISDNIARQVKLTPDAFGSLRHVRRIHQVAAFEKCPQARKKD